ncbi:MAG: hypothetical protein ACRDK5_05205 [Solirubrobacterales bacterium]
MERAAWTDERLDDFRQRVELRFDAIENQMRDGFQRTDRELVEIRGQIAGIHSTLIQFAGRAMIALGGVIVSLIGVIAAVISTG